MKTIRESLKSDIEIPEFMSCSSFEYPDAEFIIYSGEPKMLFAVLEDADEEEYQFIRHIEHSNGDEDYVVLADCMEPAWFEGKSDEEVSEHIEGVMDTLEGWYVSEIIDLDSYGE